MKDYLIVFYLTLCGCILGSNADLLLRESPQPRRLRRTQMTEIVVKTNKEGIRTKVNADETAKRFRMKDGEGEKWGIIDRSEKNIFGSATVGKKVVTVKVGKKKKAVKLKVETKQKKNGNTVTKVQLIGRQFMKDFPSSAPSSFASDIENTSFVAHGPAGTTKEAIETEIREAFDSAYTEESSGRRQLSAGNSTCEVTINVSVEEIGCPADAPENSVCFQVDVSVTGDIFSCTINLTNNWDEFLASVEATLSASDVGFFRPSTSPSATPSAVPTIHISDTPTEIVTETPSILSAAPTTVGSEGMSYSLSISSSLDGEFYPSASPSDNPSGNSTVIEGNSTEAELLSA